MEIQNSNQYRNTSTGNSSLELIEALKNYLPLQSSLLLMGIGSGKDLELLSKYYNVTGSDFSKLLLVMYQKLHPDADLINLDLIELNTKRKFDCIYSNKVLHQMPESGLKQSLQNQLNLLNENHLVIHSFWTGNKIENHHGLLWTYYTEESLLEQIPKEYKILELKTYREKIDHDSIYMVLRKK